MKVILVKNKLTEEVKRVGLINGDGDANLFFKALNENNNSPELVEYIMTDYDTRIDNAAQMLSNDGDDCLTVAEAIEAIENHENPDDYIDNVEGVLVWEPLTYRYTCSQFLDAI